MLDDAAPGHMCETEHDQSVRWHLHLFTCCLPSLCFLSIFLICYCCLPYFFFSLVLLSLTPSYLTAIPLAINPLVPAAFCAGFFFLPETKAYSRRKQAESGHVSGSLGLVSRSASVNGFDLEHPRRSVFGSFSSNKKETGIFRAHMIVSPLVAWHEVHDMWHELKDIVVHTLSRSTSYARWVVFLSVCLSVCLSVW